MAFPRMALWLGIMFEVKVRATDVVREPLGYMLSATY